MLGAIIAADPLLLALYRKGGDLPKTKVFQVFEEGRAKFPKLLCKMGFHRWETALKRLRGCEAETLELDARYVGFNVDFCRRGCLVLRLWKPHTRGQ